MAARPRQQPIRAWRGAAALVAVSALAGCAGAPKSASAFNVPDYHPLLEPGVRIVADACVQRRVLLGANHFVVGASEAVAQTLESHARAHFARRGLNAVGEPALSVCGVLNDASNPAKTHAPVADGKLETSAPPLKLSPPLQALGPRIADMPALLAELQGAAQRAAAAKEGAVVEALTLSAAAREAAAALAAPSEALLFVGLSGNSESAGKVAAQLTAIVGLGVIVAVAAAPAGAAALAGPTAAQTAATQAATSVGVQFVSIDGWLLVGALVDVRSGRVVWTHAVVASADPLRAENMGRGITTERLLLTLLNQLAAQWSAPGRAAAKARLEP
jgi:hypothetical protein